jgi:hypothetical protein
LLLKSQGVNGLAGDLKWLYNYFYSGTVRNMPTQYFMLVSKTGTLGPGSFPEIPWHKQEKENILSSVGIKVEYGEVLEEAQYRGTWKTVSDKEHSEIIRLYTQENLGLKDIAENLRRSSRTPLEHVHSHNNSVRRSGFCP